MIHITPHEVTPALRALFRTDEPQAPRCFAVLDGIAHSGKILCDTPASPTWAVVQEPYDQTLFLGGNVTRPVIARVFDVLRREGGVLIGLWLDDPRQQVLPPDPDYDGRTLEFYDRPPGKGLDPYLQRLPDGCSIHRTDRDLVMRTEWGPNDVRVAGGIDAWEQRWRGYCLMRGGEILCEATCGPPALGLYELGAFTQEAHRSKGCATITVAHLIREIESLGGQTYWNCAKQNVASVAVACKLGYRTKKEYRCMAWDTLR